MPTALHWQIGCMCTVLHITSVQSWLSLMFIYCTKEYQPIHSTQNWNHLKKNQNWSCENFSRKVGCSFVHVFVDFVEGQLKRPGQTKSEILIVGILSSIWKAYRGMKIVTDCAYCWVSLFISICYCLLFLIFKHHYYSIFHCSRAMQFFFSFFLMRTGLSVCLDLSRVCLTIVQICLSGCTVLIACI